MREANWQKVLGTMLSDDRFKDFAFYSSFGEVNGVKIGVVFATMNVGFTTFALNKEMLERLANAKREGKADEAFVVAIRVNGRKRVYCGFMPVEETCAKIDVFGLEPRTGAHGEFYILPPGFFPASESDPF
jgi:hypothetical protein